ncbi:hypothetical protein OJ998_18040 [Solirubrobacter taibaiensis]|nr:hypothetical protein [Solirubrobacter taibaiensis]
MAPSGAQFPSSQGLRSETRHVSEADLARRHERARGDRDTGVLQVRSLAVERKRERERHSTGGDRVVVLLVVLVNQITARRDDHAVAAASARASSADVRQHIGAAAAMDRVAAKPAIELVVSLVATDHVGAAAGGGVFDRGECDAPLRTPGATEGEIDTDAAAAVLVAQPVASGSSLHTVTARSRRENIGAARADEQVVPRPAGRTRSTDVGLGHAHRQRPGDG